MAGQRLGIGVVGAGRWANLAHLPRSAGLKTKVGFTFRYSPAVRYLKDMIARLVEEFGICETLKMARPDDVEFRDIEVPERYYPPGGSPRESWRTRYYANLTANFASEILGEIEGNEGNFDDGLWVQEVINAVEISHHERRWVSLPLDSAHPTTEG